MFLHIAANTFVNQAQMWELPIPEVDDADSQHGAGSDFSQNKYSQRSACQLFFLLQPELTVHAARIQQLHLSKIMLL